MNTIRIVGAIASKAGVTLYLEDGQELSLALDGWKTKELLDRALPALGRKEVVEINLDDYSIIHHIEAKTNGLVRFLRTTASIFGFKTHAATTRVVIETGAKRATEKMVAIVAGKEIAGVEALEKQMEYAVTQDRVAGFQRFMERIAAVIEGRRHTIDELMNFMQRADLPIADDGSIVAYKILRRKGGSKDVFVDCHTGKVTQRLGSHVSMDAKLVDENRRTECSTGLHIARRGYLANFSGDVVTLVKINPEDVICVPLSEPDKMRVAAYHIVQVLPHEAFMILKQNKPMTTNDVAARMLADTISGRHVGIKEYVVIGGPEGTNVTVSPAGEKTRKPILTKTDVIKALDDGEAKLVLTTEEVRQSMKKAVDQAAMAGDLSAAVSAPAAPAAPTETKAERDARRKREKRAAVKKSPVLLIKEEGAQRASKKLEPAESTSAIVSTTYDLAEVPEEVVLGLQERRRGQDEPARGGEGLQHQRQEAPGAAARARRHLMQTHPNKIVTVDTFAATIWIGGDIELARQARRDFCDEIGLCVTVAPATFVYTGGDEKGFAIGLMNYPRFPTTDVEIVQKAIELGDSLREELEQQSYSIVTPQRTMWRTWRDADAPVRRSQPTPRRSAMTAHVMNTIGGEAIKVEERKLVDRFAGRESAPICTSRTAANTFRSIRAPTRSISRWSRIISPAMAATMAPRSTGGFKSRIFYSVAEHSLYVMRYLRDVMKRPDLALEGLLHDASEAFIGDLIRPLKYSPQFRAPFFAVEEINERAVSGRFALAYPFPKEIKIADEAVTAAEVEQIIAMHPDQEFESGVLHDRDHVAPYDIQMLEPFQAKEFFLLAFHEVTGEREKYRPLPSDFRV